VPPGAQWGASGGCGPVSVVGLPNSLIIVIALVVGGCAGSTRPAPAEAPRADVQDLRVAVGEDPFLRGNPPAANVGLLARGPNPGIFETLTRLTASFGVAPGLAVRWQSLSSTRWRFVLRQGVTFHDGRPFDARAVVAMLETLAGRQSPPRGLDPGSATATGPDVVEIALSSPNLRLPEQLANPSTAIQAPGTQAGTGQDAATTPTGTGPFRFDAYRSGWELRVRANRHYWGGSPQLTSVTFHFGPETDASRLLAVRQVDAVGLVAHRALASVSGRTDRVVASPPARSSYLVVNVGGVHPWDTLKEDAVRRAVAAALNRGSVTSAGWPEHGELIDSVVPPVVLGASGDQVRPPAHDPDGARALLDRAGWAVGPDGVRVRDGKRLVLSLLLSLPGDQDRAVSPIRSQLARVGISVELADAGPEPFAAYARVNQAAFDLLLDTRLQDDANPCALCRFFSVRPGGQLTFAGAVGAGPRVDEAFDRLFEAPSVETARRITAEIMQEVVAERVVAIPLVALPSVWVVSPRLRGFEPAAVPGAQRWDQAWLSA
jgi:peptide/nickel transport system substrate-binding protein